MSPESTQKVVQILKKATKIASPVIQTFAVTITPEIAKGLIQSNENIRTLKKVVVGRYSEDMRLGLWSFTGSAIIFDWNGKLKDGQHRLDACIKTGESFDTLVVVGIDPIASLNLDTGAKRGLGDFLKNEGFDDPKNLAASIRLSYQLLDKKVVTQQTFSNEVLMHWFRDGEHEGLVEDLKRVRLWEKDLREMATGLTRTYLAAIRHAASYVPGVDIEDVDGFYSQLAGSRHIVNNRAPEYHLRLFLQQATGASTHRIQQPQRMAMTIKALNMFIAGKEAANVTPITWNPGGAKREAFPQISAGATAEIVAELEAEEAQGGGA